MASDCGITLGKLGLALADDDPEPPWALRFFPPGPCFATLLARMVDRLACHYLENCGAHLVMVPGAQDLDTGVGLRQGRSMEGVDIGGGEPSCAIIQRLLLVALPDAPRH